MERWIVAALLCLPPTAKAADVAVVSSHVVTSRRRSLSALPFKGIITSEGGWKRVTASLAGRPSRPDFEGGQACLLVVADTAGDSDSRLASVEVRGDVVHAVLLRDEATRRANDPSFKAFFVLLSGDCPGGVLLEHVTRLRDDGGHVRQAFPPLPSDHEERSFPRLGPDLRLLVRTAEGSPLPADLRLRYESRHTLSPDGRPRLARVDEVAFPHEGLPFPVIRAGFVHVYAAFADGWRCRNPLVIRTLPRKDADGSPLPIKHRFVLEPISK
ncbi:MAG: hypothetical protein D6731_11700 [Planctomycetota bacterium]|nr:MAG: hypothetical protein D6731_11700 [Planctomycetota bacterium]